ncbi:MAG: RsmG family class I SAM-dependent methyltransferase [Caldicoprobacterales bacterium]
MDKLAFKETQALHVRAEDLAKEADMRETFDFAVSRAVADLRVLFEYSLPFVRLGGYCIFNKGPTVESELKAAQRAASILGSDRPVARQVLVPFSDRSHWLVTAKKIKNTANKYPRRAGIPKKDPL